MVVAAILMLGFGEWFLILAGLMYVAGVVTALVMFFSSQLATVKALRSHWSAALVVLALVAVPFGWAIFLNQTGALKQALGGGTGHG